MGVKVEHETRTDKSTNLIEMLKTNPDIIASIKRGLADCEAGRVRPWEDIKKEHGIT